MQQIYRYIVFACLMLLSVIVTQAGTIDVSTENDLINAITTANANAGADTINILADITLTADLPAITDDLTIHGNSHTLSGGDSHGGFQVNGAVDNTITFNINNLTITDAKQALSSTYSDITLNTITIISGSGGTSVLGHTQGGSLTITNSTITDNEATIAPVYVSVSSLIISDTVISNNVGDKTGGLFAEAISVHIENSQVSGNSYNEWGGGAFISNSESVTILNSTISNNKMLTNAAKFGGGLYLYDNQTVTISGSTISGNETFYDGGGIWFSGSSLTINNSTISGNKSTATDESYGSSIFAFDGTISITNSTLTGNSAQTDTSTISASGSLILSNTIVSGNTSTGSNPDCSTANIVSNGNNIFGTNGDAGGCPAGANDIVLAGDISTLLAPLADNGGNTWTHALVENSPAIDAGNDALCPVTDQRGVARAGNHCDIGAYESPFVVDPTNTPTATNTPIPTATPIYTGTFDVYTESELIYAINTANTFIGADTINILADITLTADLPAITDDLTIHGNSHTLNGADTYKAFVGENIALNIDNLTITQTVGAISTTDSDVVLSNATITYAVFGTNSAVYQYRGSLKIVDSYFDHNEVNYAAIHARDATPLIITNSSIRNTIGGQAGGLFAYHNNSTVDEYVTIENSIISDNAFGNSGGGAFIRGATNVMITNSTFSNSKGILPDRGGYGGGLFLADNQAVTIKDSTISNNSAKIMGGGIWFRGNSLIIDNSTISDNFASDRNGGGIFAEQGDVTDTIVIHNTTISGNQTDYATGTAISSVGYSISITNSTIVNNNTAQRDTSAILASGSVTLSNTIVSGNTSTGSNPDCSTANIVSNGNNVFGVNNNAGGCPAGANDIVLSGSIDTLLAPLADNGGNTWTHALVENSPAIDAGNDVLCPATDQRGIARAGNHCDIGAYESPFVVNPTNTPTATNTPILTATHTATFTPTLTPSNTPTDTATHTPSNTPTHTATHTATVLPSNTSMPSNTPEILAPPILNNGGFEGEKFQGVPSGWAGKNTTLFGKDKQKCNKPEIDKYIARSGDCAFMFKGNPVGVKVSRIKQQITDRVFLNHGDVITLGVYINPKSAPVGTVFAKLKVNYSDNTKGLIKLRIPDADAYVQVQNNLTIDLANGRTITKVLLMFTYNQPNGKYIIDDASVTVK